MMRLSTRLTASLVFCRRNLSAGRRGCWQPGCVLAWTAPAQRRRVRERSDAGRHWGYLETENGSIAIPPTGQWFWEINARLFTIIKKQMWDDKALFVNPVSTLEPTWQMKGNTNQNWCWSLISIYGFNDTGCWLSCSKHCYCRVFYFVE